VLVNKRLRRRLAQDDVSSSHEAELAQQPTYCPVDI
jgi:hypothetical protein